MQNTCVEKKKKACILQLFPLNGILQFSLNVKILKIKCITADQEFFWV